jgi:GNAT superfamily N-acetyltransferase
MSRVARLTPSSPEAPPSLRKAFHQGADAALVDGENHAALWWSAAPPIAGERVGCIGALQLASASSSLPILEEAAALLASSGVTLAVAPIDGNTWRTHRAVTFSSDRPPFPLEPVTPQFYPDAFLGAGFQPLAGYSSSLIDLAAPPPDLAFLESAFGEKGVQFRPVRPETLDEDLKSIHRLSLVAFRDNFLYTPLAEEEFLAMYGALGPLFDPRLTELAEHEGRLVGFIFAMPGSTDPRVTPSTVVVKTLAVLPERAYAGLGTLLVDRVQRTARQLGCTEAIHALQRDDNQSLRISRRFDATVFRRYTLFGRRLGGRSLHEPRGPT